MSSRPDFAILVYPVISMGEKGHAGSRKNLLGGETASADLVELYSNEKQVTDRTPPTFLAHPLDDTVVVPDNSRLFYEAAPDSQGPREVPRASEWRARPPWLQRAQLGCVAEAVAGVAGGAEVVPAVEK